MANTTRRREFLKSLGVKAAALPFVLNLPTLAHSSAGPKQRLVFVFSPNGVVPKNFWPDHKAKEFKLPEILTPLEPFKDKLLTLHGVSDKIRGDGDNHMRGIGCLLTGIELFPGNIQGGSDTPAGWASGISIDQEIKNFLQNNSSTCTRFGSLELGVMVPERADTWTRMSYRASNEPVAPIDNPYQLFNRLYGTSKDRALLASILDDVHDDLKRIANSVPAEDRQLIEQHTQFVRDMERDLKQDAQQKLHHAIPDLEPNIREENDNMPRITKMQIDLLVNSLANDFARIATFQFTNSVGQAKMHWIGIHEGHHELSHEPDSNVKAQEKLTKINKWFCEQIAYFAKRLAETPEPGGTGSMLDHTTIVWTNELGKGNSHTLENTPFILVGGGLGFKTGRALDFKGVAHNRLLMTFAHAFGHHIKTFGNPRYCADGPLVLS